MAPNEDPTTTAPSPSAQSGVDEERQANMKAMVEALTQRNPTVEALLNDILYVDASRTVPIPVPSGILNARGEELAVTVTVRDIGDKGLLAAYEDAKRKGDAIPASAPDRNARVADLDREAHLMLWEKCVTAPPELASREAILRAWPRLPTRFREGLSVRILRANGVQGFLEAVSLL